MGKAIDLTGQRFGMLTVIERSYERKHKSRHTMWLCQCDCGNKKVLSSLDLLHNKTISCGCKLSHKKEENPNYIDGRSDTRLYRIWKSMKQRCNDPNCRIYKWYGAEGKRICEEWNDFTKFRDWSMNNGYADNLTIDRIDVEKGYSPDNCRWTDLTTQNNNRRDNVFIEFDGERKTMSEWSRITGMPKQTIRKRYIEKGWDAKKTLTTPMLSKNIPHQKPTTT